MINSQVSPPSIDSMTRRPLLVVVEGVNDVEFLVRLSRQLSQADSSFPSLADLKNSGRIVFVPFGGGNLTAWTDRFEPLGCPEFHLYDREMPPETERREAAAAFVASRSGCRSFMTSKRALENYLHPKAIAAAGGGEISFDEDDCVTSVLARAWFEPGRIWRELPGGVRSRFSQHAKRWLNTVAVEQMTPELLDESDPAGDIRTWLQTIAAMAPAD